MQFTNYFLTHKESTLNNQLHAITYIHIHFMIPMTIYICIDMISLLKSIMMGIFTSNKYSFPHAV